MTMEVIQESLSFTRWSIVVLKNSDIQMRLEISGYAWPLSHFAMAWRDTYIFSANSSCVKQPF